MELTCAACGKRFTPQRTWKKLDKCADCRDVGVCSVCSGPTLRTGQRGKVPTICSSACRGQLNRQRVEHLKKDAAAYHAAKSRHAEAVRKDIHCVECGELIPFVVGARRATRCAVCRPKHERVRTQAKDRNRHWRRSGIDMTAKRYAEMVAEQQGRCAICLRPGEHWHVDHDHVTGKTRSLLCINCNMAIGQLGDDPDRIRAAAEYIEKHRQSMKENYHA